MRRGRHWGRLRAGGTFRESKKGGGARAATTREPPPKLAAAAALLLPPPLLSPQSRRGIGRQPRTPRHGEKLLLLLKGRG
jgi:hypothetical protein